MKLALAALALAVCIAVSLPVSAGSNRVQPVRVRARTTTGTRAVCPEDERLVPIRSKGYSASRPGGWVYKCKTWD